MIRLHELNRKQIMKWQVARQDAGTEKYGDDHLKRYGLVDVMEKLLDAKNILMKLHDRLLHDDEIENIDDIQALIKLINMDIEAIKEFDELLPDKVCTDEKGGDRIWWPNKWEYLKSLREEQDKLEKENGDVE